MAEMKYLALLRGINVGGNNIIKMTDLKSCFEGMGFTGVSTYIQSGNVIFDSEETSQIDLTDKIETTLSSRFNYDSKIILVPYPVLDSVVKNAPPGFGKDAGVYRNDVIFTDATTKPDEIWMMLNPREGVDEAWAGEYTLYFRRLTSRASQTRLTRLISLPVYKHLSIRNWNTTLKLYLLMNGNAD